MTIPRRVAAGTVCGCDCNCRVPLTAGNVMAQDITNDPATPWEHREVGPNDDHVWLLLCVNCYVGAHPL